VNTNDEKGNKEILRLGRILERILHSQNYRTVKIDIATVRCEECGTILIREKCMTYNVAHNPLVWIVCPFTSNKTDDKHSLFLYDENTKEIN
jgi:hypothetical protein